MTRKDELNKLAKAANNIRLAIQALEDVQLAGGFSGADAGYYKTELQELLSCDGGESGLVNLIKILELNIQKGR